MPHHIIGRRNWACRQSKGTQHSRINSVTSKTSYAHAPAVFNDERGHFLACDNNSPPGHADHDAEHHEPDDNRRKHCAKCVVPSRTSHKHGTVSLHNCPSGPCRPGCRAPGPDANDGNTARKASTSKTSKAHATANVEGEQGHFHRTNHDARHLGPADKQGNTAKMHRNLQTWPCTCHCPCRQRASEASVSQRNCPPDPYRP